MGLHAHKQNICWRSIAVWTFDKAQDSLTCDPKKIKLFQNKVVFYIISHSQWIECIETLINTKICLSCYQILLNKAPFSSLVVWFVQTHLTQWTATCLGKRNDQPGCQNGLLRSSDLGMRVDQLKKMLELQQKHKQQRIKPSSVMKRKMPLRSVLSRTRTGAVWYKLPAGLCNGRDEVKGHYNLAYDANNPVWTKGKKVDLNHLLATANPKPIYYQIQTEAKCLVVQWKQKLTGKENEVKLSSWKLEIIFINIELIKAHPCTVK